MMRLFTRLREAIMIDQLFKFAIMFDWISPVLAVIQNVTQGPAHVFAIPKAVGWSGADIERLLGRYGIAAWGKMILNDHFVFSVRQSQARWAEYVLSRAGLPIANGAVSAQGSATRRAGRPAGTLAQVDQWLDRVDEKLRF
jgi:hypothetical protein